MTKILVVDDEQDLREILRFNLQGEGFEVSTAGSAEEALALMEQTDGEDYALVILDVMMERMSGYDMAQHLRQQGDNTPIIFLTARDGHDDQLAGFAHGADDYITKPFAFDTVLARIKAVLKRTQPTATNETVFGTLSIDTANMRVCVAGKEVELTRREYRILCLLAQHPEYYFTREEILDQVWPNDTLVNDRSVDVHIARLRKKLGGEGWRVANKTGFGYTLKK
jgi:DNA-binding response OmpR family regulator